MQINSTGKIATIVRQKRKELGLTQVALAQLCNVGVRFLSELENAKPTCQLDKTFKVLNGLGVRLEARDDK